LALPAIERAAIEEEFPFLALWEGDAPGPVALALRGFHTERDEQDEGGDATMDAHAE